MKRWLPTLAIALVAAGLGWLGARYLGPAGEAVLDDQRIHIVADDPMRFDHAVGVLTRDVVRPCSIPAPLVRIEFDRLTGGSSVVSPCLQRHGVVTCC